jgi:hypothetical protein
MEQSYRWLEFGYFKRETGSAVVAAEDQTVNTNDFKNKILKKEIDNKCRLCQQHEETVDRLTSGCPILAKNEYLMRHNRVDTH